MVGSGGGYSDFFAALLAMVSHDLRQSLQMIVGAHDMR
jgi:K+-sensing histidine kinase KdpD